MVRSLALWGHSRGKSSHRGNKKRKGGTEVKTVKGQSTWGVYDIKKTSVGNATYNCGRKKSNAWKGRSRETVKRGG